MSKVYVVTQCFDWDGMDCPIGVFDDDDLARKCIKGQDDGSWYIHTFEINQEGYESYDFDLSPKDM